MSVDSLVHHALITGFIQRGHPPRLEAIAAQLNASHADVAESLRRLHESHGVVLHPESTAVWVVHPFSASPTAVWARSGDRGWWAPCVWCALGVVALTADDAQIHVRLGGEQHETRIVIEAGKLSSADLPVHFAMSPRDAWNNVIHWCAMVLPFERVEHVAQWCSRHALPHGETVPLSQVLELAREWYGRHDAPDWKKWTILEAQAIFERVGLRGEFWRLPVIDGTF